METNLVLLGPACPLSTYYIPRLLTLATYLPYLPTYLPTYLTYLTYLPTYLPTLPTYLPTYLLT